MIHCNLPIRTRGRGAGGRPLAKGQSAALQEAGSELRSSASSAQECPFLEPLELGRNSSQIPRPSLASAKTAEQPNAARASPDEFKTITGQHVFPMKARVLKQISFSFVNKEAHPDSPVYLPGRDESVSSASSLCRLRRWGAAIWTPCVPYLGIRRPRGHVELFEPTRSLLKVFLLVICKGEPPAPTLNILVIHKQ